MRDMVHKGRSASGERHGKAKLTWADVVAIRTEYVTGAITLTALGARYGVGPSAIWGIVHKEKWIQV